LFGYVSFVVRIIPKDRSDPTRSTGLSLFRERSALLEVGTVVGIAKERWCVDVCLYTWVEGCLEGLGIAHLAEWFGKVHAAVS